MPRLSYRISTLGCRVNHAETRDIESLLISRGLTTARAGEAADLEIVHSCSVTRAAAAKSRHALRQAARRSARLESAPLEVGEPSGQARQACRVGQLEAPWSAPEVIVTGCYASTDPEEAASITGDPSCVVGHEDDDGSSLITRLERQVDAWLHRRGAFHSIRTGAAHGSLAADDDAILPLPVVEPIASAGGRTDGGAGPARRARHVRAEVRIQDGCDAHCTFCIIPRIRRTLRSKTIADTVREVRHLVDLGHREIVLTGIFIGAYGHETALRRRQRGRHSQRGAEPLADLLDAVAQVEGLERLRISSLEPGDVTGALLDAMVANAPIVVPHLHLPLQSGSDSILRRMNRQYGIGDYLEMIDAVEAALTDDRDPAAPLPPAITTDVICGFPGETEEDFERTVAVARRVGFLHMHVFPYSARPGTAAARWRSVFVPDAVKKARVRRLLDLEHDPVDGLSIQYRRRLLDRTVRVIAEQPDRRDPAFTTGRCDRYALVHLPGPLPRGRMVEVVVSAVDPARTIGRIAPASIRLPVLSTVHPLSPRNDPQYA